MRIRNLRIYSYGSFQDSGDVQFAPGLNLIVGANNTGKSLVLSALKWNYENQPHCDSENFAPERVAPSEVDIEVSTLAAYLR